VNRLPDRHVRARFATFTAQSATDGVTYNVTASGTLTIHGVARQVEIALEARLVGDVIVVVGSADLTFSDYGVDMPRAPIVLSVADNGQIEFQLFFTRASAAATGG